MILLFLSTNTVTDIECSGSPDGYIDLSVSGGTFPYTYSWTSKYGFSATTEMLVIYYQEPIMFSVTVKTVVQLQLVKNFL